MFRGDRVDKSPQKGNLEILVLAMIKRGSVAIIFRAPSLPPAYVVCFPGFLDMVPYDSERSTPYRVRIHVIGELVSKRGVSGGFEQEKII